MSEANYNIGFENGNVVIALTYGGDKINADLSIEVALIDLLKIAAAKTDNKVDDAIVAMVAKALEA